MTISRSPIDEHGSVTRRRFARRRAGRLWRAVLALSLAAAVSLVTVDYARSGPPAAPANASKDNPITGHEITPQQKEAVDRGLAYLAANQGKDGGFSHNMSAAGITGLCGVAFMEQGNLPGRGKYGENVRRALKFVLASCQPSGLISSDNTHGPMYGHGFATLFLGEVYGMTGDEDVKEKLENAVRLIERTQNKEGGWRYQPAPVDADISVTICEIMGLRAARDAGIKVDEQVIDGALAYVRRCQNADGGFSYVAGQGSGSGFARSAAGIASLYYARKHANDDADNINRGLKYLSQFTPTKAGGGMDQEGHFFYGNYYAVQAMFLAGGDYWARWYPGIRDVLIARQQSNGSWTGDASEDFATACALIILQMPNRYLPVFNGKGAGD